jgi:hypothetical protein
VIFRFFNYFLAAAAGYAFARSRVAQEQARLESEVCFQVISDPTSLPEEVSDYFAMALARGARLLTRRVGDTVQVLAQDSETGELVGEYVAQLEGSLGDQPPSEIIEAEVVA